VQEYLVAISEERWEDAVAVIHPDWLGQCGADDLSPFATTDFTAELGTSDGFGGGFGGGFVGGFVEQRFDEVEAVAGDEPLPEADTTVEVTINHDDVGGLASGWSEYVVFEMTDEDDFWWISGDPWPYFVWNCRGSG
jgi:hypothetical protein